ncbi:Fe-S cluster assembly sulfur transfer protein SufU [Aerococcus sanguinicola]|uniref:Fe-S cluster assembly sulfur transfer protein SufU n=1 Tax=unclassified Aerococcus TaxID=2618060 RepID=UPI0008A21AFA|nr:MULTISPECIES: SUF system NifU family Fe-S cluster assembly protein [unclassified Aerococcus]KAB0646848.1 SUF system NifU family Fe-S cluster assembly protein [Aerococcus sanguinicola]MDK6234156.1 SUF system NifU family Fe-S cluster assembly protein [Aerococcus sp. UMB10185]MDK6855417.1 SUF system NifU family Fe-S cluster assembly protein [Aerococcus sp. UMB7533]OFN00476.1 iron-sulfur cluster assembly scaffold protein [Aerococcus sp. HMSC062A02]OHO46012.1 iron-sulfur cluster assembly scaffol
MALSKMENLYRAVIVDHYQNPHHHGALDQATQTIEMLNPTCGDVIFLDLKIEDDKITDLAFHGQGCAISTASTSMMTDLIKGKTVEEALSLAHNFNEMITLPELDEDTDYHDQLGEASLLSGVRKFPARVKCATLGWQALQEGIHSDEETVEEDVEEGEDE